MGDRVAPEPARPAPGPSPKTLKGREPAGVNSMKRTPKQCEEELENRRKFARRIIPIKTAKEKCEYEAERQKHEKFYERQKVFRKQPYWKSFANRKKIKPENLFIGAVPDEDELDKKHIALMKIEVEEREKAEPIFNVIRHDDGKVTLTINTRHTRELIYHELDKVLGPSPNKKRFRTKEQNKALDVFYEREPAKTPPLSHIARNSGISYSTAKTRWRRAYYLLYGETYNPRRVKPERKKAALELCSACRKPECFSVKNGRMEQILCADFVALAGKDYQREKTMSKKQLDYSQFGEVDTREAD